MIKEKWVNTRFSWSLAKESIELAEISAEGSDTIRWIWEDDTEVV